jgi:hypothetical protein
MMKTVLIMTVEKSFGLLLGKLINSQRKQERIPQRLRRDGLALKARGGKNGRKRSVIAVARKLAVLLHRLWVTGEVYEPLRRNLRSPLAFLGLCALNDLGPLVYRNRLELSKQLQLCDL